jgi:2-(1,2-epoxy-1,2-dihydrophenyl)acetyl-CoA isomerase
VGLAKAKEIALFGEILEADAAVALGLVNRVVPADELDAFVDGWAQRLAAAPTLALTLTKSMLNFSLSSSMGEAIENEARSQAVNFASQDFGEALSAFREKRPPHFTGR